jgi:competence protein ComEC
MTGDLERGGERRLQEAGLLPRDAAVWKAGHHGSATSGTAALLEVVRPRLVLISCGVENRHGHPSHGPYTVAADSLAILRTDLDGSIHLRWDEAGGLVAARRGGPLDTP